MGQVLSFPDKNTPATSIVCFIYDNTEVIGSSFPVPLFYCPWSNTVELKQVKCYEWWKINVTQDDSSIYAIKLQHRPTVGWLHSGRTLYACITTHFVLSPLCLFNHLWKSSFLSVWYFFYWQCIIMTRQTQIKRGKKKHCNCYHTKAGFDNMGYTI